MEKKLMLLFDYQKFSKNDKVDRIIESVNNESKKLTDEDLEGVVAAGDLTSNKKKPEIKNFE